MLFVFFFSIEVEAVYFNGQIAIRAFFFFNKFQLEHVFMYSSTVCNPARAKLHLKPKDVVCLKTHLNYNVIDYQKKALSYLVILYRACSFTIQYPLPLWRMPYLPCGSKMLFTPPNLTFIFKQRLDRVCGVVLCTFFIWTHCVAIPSTVSPTRFTSAAKQRKKLYIYFVYHKSNKRRRHWVSDTWSFSKMIV